MSVHIGHLLVCYLNVSAQRSYSGMTMKCQYIVVTFWSDKEMSVRISHFLE